MHAFRWALYAMLCAAGVWTHFVAAFVPIGHAAWLGWRAVRHREIGQAIRLHIHSIKLPISGLQDTLAQMMSNKAIDAKN